MLDVINSVGLGDRVLKIIERRHKRDMYITYGGMVRALTRRQQHRPAPAAASTPVTPPEQQRSPRAAATPARSAWGD
jgi:hypothetical protein